MGVCIRENNISIHAVLYIYEDMTAYCWGFSLSSHKYLIKKKKGRKTIEKWKYSCCIGYFFLGSLENLVLWAHVVCVLGSENHAWCVVLISEDVTLTF